jgi:hypothetical protein
MTTKERTTPDHDTQLKAVRELRQLLELLAPKIPANQPTVPVQINVMVPWSAQPRAQVTVVVPVQREGEAALD